MKYAIAAILILSVSVALCPCSSNAADAPSPLDIQRQEDFDAWMHGDELAMLSPEEEQHLRGIIREEVGAAIPAGIVPTHSGAMAVADLTQAADNVKETGSFWGSWKGATSVVLITAAVAWGVVEIVEHARGETHNNWVNNGTNQNNGGSGDQTQTSESAPEE